LYYLIADQGRGALEDWELSEAVIRADRVVEDFYGLLQRAPVMETSPDAQVAQMMTMTIEEPGTGARAKGRRHNRN